MPFSGYINFPQVILRFLASVTSTIIFCNMLQYFVDDCKRANAASITRHLYIAKALT